MAALTKLVRKIKECEMVQKVIVEIKNKYNLRLKWRGWMPEDKFLS